VRWQVTLIVTGILILAGLMAYLALSFTVRHVPAPGGTYIEGVVGQPQFINPLLCSFNEPDRDICALVFNGLVKFDERGAPQPDLASRWTISDDDENYGLIYTFHLRDDVTWQDGQPFTADDVIFTIGLLHPSFPGRPDIGALWRTVEAVKIDDRTVQMTLQEPFAPFLDYTAVGMLPVHILHGASASELLDHPFNRQPVGTGPFRVKELVSEPGRPQRIVLETNPRYFGRQPYINEVEFKYYATAAEAFEAYRVGEIHGLSPIKTADLDLVRETPSLNLFTAPISGLSLIFLNTNDPNSPFFQEEDVRKALLLALDRQAIVDGVLGAQAVVANGPFHQNSWAYDPDTPPIEQDISRARQLLARAGWIPSEDDTGSASSGNSDLIPEVDSPVVPRIETRGSDALRLKSGVPLSFTLLVSSDQFGVARAVAHQWRVIGVNAEVRPVQVGLASNYLQARQYQAALANIVFDSPDPDPYPFWHETKASAGQNYSQFKDRDVSEVLEAARRVFEPERRAELYRRFSQMFNEKVPAIVLYYPLYSYGVNQRIRGVQLGPLLTPADRLQTLADWFVIERRVIANSGQLTP
jgi:peptide/nickel transport system substrate-binding protein